MNRREFIQEMAIAAAGIGATGILGGSATAQTAIDTPQGKKEKMKILILTGSPRKKGNSATLADYFTKGVTEAGHEVVRFDAAYKKVHPCRACNSCGMDGPCVFEDDFDFVRTHIMDAGCVVFATPMYYFGISSQLKAVIDRFYAINGKIHVPKKAVLLMTYANTAASEAVPIKSHYEVLLRYLGWTDAGQVIAPGVRPVGAINRTKYPEQAYQLGKKI